jgi:anti-sigma B factor antagonist
MLCKEATSLSKEDRELRFSAHLSAGNGAAVLHCTGRLRFSREAAVFARMAREVLADGRNLILDLSAVETIDSAGIGELVMVYMRACAAQREVRIASPKKRVQDLLQLTNVGSLFQIYPTLDEAIASLPREVT